MSKSKNVFWFFVFDVPIGPTLSSAKHVISSKKYSGIDFVTEYQQIFRDPKYFKSITEYFFEW